MKKIPFIAQDLSLNLRAFLYACAFWTVAADEELKSEEQKWLVDQFGADGATDSLNQFVGLESDDFFKAFDGAAAALSDDERRKAYPFLEDWLLQCADVDGAQDVSELQIINKIKGRLNLEGELSRLFGTAGNARADSVGDGTAEILRGHESGVLSVALAGDKILSGSEDGHIRIWDSLSYECVKDAKVHDGGVMTIRACAQKSLACSGGRYGEVVLWNSDDGTIVWEHQHRRMGGIMDADINAANGTIVVATNIGVALEQELETGKLISEFDDRKRGALRAVRYLPGGNVVVGGDYKAMRVCDLKAGKVVQELEGHNEGVLCIDVSPDGKTLASGSRDNAVRIWDVESGKCKAELEGHEFSIYGVDFDASGERLLSVSWDHTMRVWDLNTGKVIVKMESTEGMFSAGAFDKSDRLVVGGTSDKVLYVVPLG